LGFQNRFLWSGDPCITVKHKHGAIRYMAMIFTIGSETIRAHDDYFENRYRDYSGIGFGDAPLDAVKSFIDADLDELEVMGTSDVVTEWERDLSNVGFALYKGRKRGVDTVNVSAFGSQ